MLRFFERLSDFSVLNVRAVLNVTTLGIAILVENKGLEPLTPCVQGRCSPS